MNDSTYKYLLLTHLLDIEQNSGMLGIVWMTKASFHIRAQVINTATSHLFPKYRQKRLAVEIG